MNFNPSLNFNHTPKPLSLSDAISMLVDHAIVDHDRREYAQNRGSGVGEVAKKRIGAGYIGDPCDMHLALRYHGYPEEPRAPDAKGVKPGELKRHAEAGHWTEARTADWLTFAGFDLKTHRVNEDGSPKIGYSGKPEQFGFKAARDPVTGQYRLAGEVDGIIMGVPDNIHEALPQSIRDTLKSIKVPCIWESKKATDKKWKDFSKNGVAGADAKYHGQICTTMAYMEIEHCLFSMLNLDNMKYYWELVPIDLGVAQKLTDRAVRIFQSDSPRGFMRIANDPNNHKCMFCQRKCACQEMG